jgi:hypothetical protein
LHRAGIAATAIDFYFTMRVSRTLAARLRATSGFIRRGFASSISDDSSGRARETARTIGSFGSRALRLSRGRSWDEETGISDGRLVRHDRLNAREFRRRKPMATNAQPLRLCPRPTLAHCR